MITHTNFIFKRWKARVELFSYKSEELVSDPACKMLLVSKKNLLTSDYWRTLFGILKLSTVYIKIYLKVKILPHRLRVAKA